MAERESGSVRGQFKERKPFHSERSRRHAHAEYSASMPPAAALGRLEGADTLARAGYGRSSITRAVRVGGLGRSELLQALRDHRVQLNQAAEALFEDHRFLPNNRERVIEIALLSVADLGFDEGATYGQITARALESGLAECPLELGPYLRMQFLDQPEVVAGAATTHGGAPPGAITVASSPLDDRDETPKGFYLRRVDGVLWLRGYWSWSGHIWSEEDVLVFARAY